MSDMLVKLYALPELPQTRIQELEEEGYAFRRALAPEKHLVLPWVREHFSDYWASEVSIAFSRQPVSCFLAIREGVMQGFACYETTQKAFFGPTGVHESQRGKGLGKLLLLMALHGLRDLGYAYGIIGGVGPAGFYQQAVGATLIPGSKPGIYEGLLRPRKEE
ncbi:MAG: GNAT family N-acetyltransferase [Bacteroidota bacterium]